MMRSLASHPDAVGAPQGPRQHRPSLVGMRRVDWVRITIEPEWTRSDVVGVGHRQPVTRRVPLQIAAALIANGTPAVFRHPPAPDGSD